MNLLDGVNESDAVKEFDEVNGSELVNDCDGVNLSDGVKLLDLVNDEDLLNVLLEVNGSVSGILSPSHSPRWSGVKGNVCKPA